jgi:hypothetical protein
VNLGRQLSAQLARRSSMSGILRGARAPSHASVDSAGPVEIRPGGSSWLQLCSAHNALIGRSVKDQNFPRCQLTTGRARRDDKVWPSNCSPLRQIDSGRSKAIPGGRRISLGDCITQTWPTPGSRSAPIKLRFPQKDRRASSFSRTSRIPTMRAGRRLGGGRNVFPTRVGLKDRV